MKNENEVEKEKREKAGNPLFVVIIFVALLGFLFVIPEVYKKYNKEIADFLGVGKNEEELKHDLENKKENDIISNSAFYQIGSKSTFTYNQVTVSDISLNNGILNMKLTTSGVEELKDLDYYVEFYQNQSVFLGRRRLNGVITRTLDVSLDVSNMNVDTTTYIMLSHISDDGIPSVELPTDESDLSQLNCVFKEQTYTYEFYQKGLNKVINKFTYHSDNVDEYTDTLLKYKKKEKDLNELNGITANISENSGTFVFTSEFNYNTVKSFNRVSDAYIFSKGVLDKDIKLHW